MTTRIATTDGDHSALIDRLVCGELNGARRRALIGWLEEEPRRWRTCGLAFLEAQVWGETCGPWTGVEAEPSVTGQSAPTTAAAPAARISARRNRSPGRIVAAACVLFAFGLGFGVRDFVGTGQPQSQPSMAGAAKSSASSAPTAVHDLNRPPPVEQPILASLDVRTDGGFGPLSSIHIPVVPSDSEAARAANEIPDDLRRQWERRGYKLSVEQRYLFAKLPDGQSVVVPVAQVQANRIPVNVN